jgi:hypothetical protein
MIKIVLRFLARSSFLVLLVDGGLSRAANAAEPAGLVDAQPAPTGFGAHRVVVSLGNLQALNQRTDGGTLSPSGTNLAGSLAADLVLKDGWTVGLGATASWVHATSAAVVGSQSTYGASARLGRVVPLSSFASVWPVVGLGATRGPRLFPTNPETAFVASLDLPLVFHASPRFFVGAGPTLAASTGGYVDVATLYGRLFFGGAFG